MSSTLLGSFPRAHNMSIGGVDMVVTPISASQQSIGFSVKHRSLQIEIDTECHKIKRGPNPNEIRILYLYY